MKIVDRINQMRHVRESKEQACRVECSLMRPMKENLGEIPSLYDSFRSVANPECKDNTKIFILLVYFMYNPVSLIDKGIRSKGLRREIARVLGLSNSAVTIYFGDAKSLLLNHKGFRDEAQRVFEAMASMCQAG